MKRHDELYGRVIQKTPNHVIRLKTDLAAQRLTLRVHPRGKDGAEHLPLAFIVGVNFLELSLKARS